MNRYQKMLLFVIIGISGVYIGLVLMSDINKISYHFFTMKVEYIIPILLSKTVSFFLLSVRQKHFLSSIGIHLDVLTNFKLYLASLSMIITPGGSGLLIKSEFLKRLTGDKRSKTFPIIIFERFQDFLAIVTITIMMSLLYYLFEAMIVIILSSIFLVMIYAIFRKPNFLLIILKKINKMKFLNRFVPDEKFHESMIILSNKNNTLFGWSIGIFAWMFDALAIYFGFVAFDVDFNFIETTVIFFSAMIFGVISLLPAGIGVTEGSFIGILLKNGIELSKASALILMVRFLTIWYATVLGVVFTRLILKKNEK